MVIKLSNIENSYLDRIERHLYTKHFSLFLNKKRCISCEICKTICPREAIDFEIKTLGAIVESKIAKLKIDETKCMFCGICVSLCPTGALNLEINGKKFIPVQDKECFPNLIRDIIVNEKKCPSNCIKCEKVCPFELIKVEKSNDEKSVKVNIKKENCPACRICEIECPEGIIKLHRIFSGIIKIDKNECPKHCHNCVDVCPIPQVLTLDDDNKVRVNDLFCIFCGTCQIVCPSEKALTLKRTRINVSNIRSGTWNKTLEKLTSTKSVSKELNKKTSLKVRETLIKRFK
jgi:4Fe-4S ferredoxin